MRDILSMNYGAQHHIMRIRGLYKKNESELNEQLAACLATLQKENATRVISGHFPYGIGEKLDGKSEYFCFLRHPIDYTLSQYYYILYFIRNGMTPYDSSAEYSLYDMLDTWPGKQFNNYQTRFLATQDCNFEMITNQPISSDMLLNKAINLISDRSVLAFPTDQFVDAVAFLSKRYNWKSSSYRKRKVNNFRPRDLKVSQRIVDKILDQNSADMAIYKLAKSLLRSLNQQPPKERVVC